MIAAADASGACMIRDITTFDDSLRWRTAEGVTLHLIGLETFDEHVFSNASKRTFLIVNPHADAQSVVRCVALQPWHNGVSF